jgi:hypothetical protein|tara:strand:- start:22373 stop:22558 length:186 start_codon:yes stop_codon:yes gene_type:complete
MKKVGLLLFVAFLFYLIGHLSWTFFAIFEGNTDFKFWIISLPFAIFSVFGLLAGLKLYNNS